MTVFTFRQLAPAGEELHRGLATENTREASSTHLVLASLPIETHPLVYDLFRLGFVDTSTDTHHQM